MAYTFTAAQVPVPLGPTLAVQRSAATSSSVGGAGNFPAYTPGVLSPQTLNKELIDLDNATLYGGLGYGVASGLTMSAVGLTVTLAAGIAVAGGLCYNDDDYDFTAPDNEARVFVWMKQDQTVVVTTYSSDGLVPPSSHCALLGVLTTSGGSVTVIDYSGVCYLLGGLPVRNTADAGMPGGSPNSRPVFLTVCPSGTWVWDGSQFAMLSGPMPLMKSTLESGDAVYIPASYQALLFGSLTVPPGATLTVDGDLRVIA